MNLIRKNSVFLLKDLANRINGEIVGDENISLTGISPIDDAKEGTITFLHNKKYFKFINTTDAAAIIVPKSHKKELQDVSKTLVFVEDPYLAFQQLFAFFYEDREYNFDANERKNLEIGENCRISSKAYIGANVKIGNGVVIYPFVFIGDSSVIGDNVIIYPNVSILEEVVVGNNVIIQAGAVIGSDGFGFVPSANGYIKIPQVGNVVIEDSVEVGANTTIDRAALNHTLLKKGVKVDNLCQIAHNVEVDENSAIAAQTGISGSTKLGKNVVLGGQVGTVGHIKIGNNVQIGAKSGISKDIPDNQVWTGYPARPFAQARRSDAYVNRLGKYVDKIKELEKRLSELENRQ